jgi:integrase
MSEPFWWEERQAWYVNLNKANGKRGRVKLHATKKRAFELWKAMDTAKAATDPLLAAISDEWIGNLKARVLSGTLSQGHLDNATSCVLEYLATHKTRRWSDFTRDNVTQYVSEQSWATSTKRKRMGLLRSLSSYGHQEHKLPDNLAKLKRPRETSRDYFATAEDYRQLVEHTMTSYAPRRPFAMYLAALWHTGARPGELAGAKIKHRRGNAIILDEHKNARKTGRPRAIYLSDRAQVVVNMAIGERTDPEAYIFGDARGNTLSMECVGRRIAIAREKRGLSPSLVAYSLRHGYAHRALTSGVEVATIATLMGTSVELIINTYGHLHDAQNVLASAAGRVR